MSISRYAAFHEAGHAVIRIVLDLPFRSVFVCHPKSGPWLGAVDGARDDLDPNTDDLQRLFDESVACWSGIAAQARYSHRSWLEIMMNGGRDDVRNATALCLAAGVDQQHALEAAKDIVASQWAYVERVAKALLDDQVLSRAEVEALA